MTPLPRIHRNPLRLRIQSGDLPLQRFPLRDGDPPGQRQRPYSHRHRGQTQDPCETKSNDPIYAPIHPGEVLREDFRLPPALSEYRVAMTT